MHGNVCDAHDIGKKMFCKIFGHGKIEYTDVRMCVYLCVLYKYTYTHICNMYTYIHSTYMPVLAM